MIVTSPEHCADGAETPQSGAVQQLLEWLRQAKAERRKRQEAARQQAFLRTVDPAVLEDLGYEVRPDEMELAQQDGLVIALDQMARRD